jgi:hypothetical protein
MNALSHDFESPAFTVVQAQYATGYWTFGDWLGHNLGYHHDRQNATGDPLFA